MGCGTLCLSYKYPGIEKEYKIGKHLDVWEDFDDLKDKIKYYLKNDYLRDKIAKAGCEYVAKPVPGIPAEDKELPRSKPAMIRRADRSRKNRVQDFFGGHGSLKFCGGSTGR